MTAIDKELTPEQMHAQQMSSETVRRQHKVSKELIQAVQEAYVCLDLNEILDYKIKDRAKWLDKALQAAAEGRISLNKCYDIFSHMNFDGGVNAEYGALMLDLVKARLPLFTRNQQRHIKSDNFGLQKKFAPVVLADSSDDEEEIAAMAADTSHINKTLLAQKSKKAKKREREREEYDKAKRERLGLEGDEDGTGADVRPKIERRIDPADGEAYTKEEFVQEYRNSEEWDRAAHTSFMFHS